MFICVLFVDMATQFYLTLPSNSSMKYFPDNTVANFKVKLAETIELTGDWEVALSEFNYPHTWSTIREGNRQTFIYNTGVGYNETGLIQDTHFNTIPDLVKALNGCMTKEGQTKIKFSYNRNTRKITIDVKKDAMVWFSGDIATALGFEQDTLIKKKTVSPYVADINVGFSSMYLYTNIVDVQFVGDVKVPLLRIVNTKGKYGENVNVTFRNLQYVPVKVKSFETIEIDIKDDKNENVSFEFGKSIVTLHFRQSRSQYFI